MAQERGLTSGEITMLQKVFGNSIHYNEVKISSATFDRGVTRGDNISIPKIQYHTDFPSFPSSGLGMNK